MMTQHYIAIFSNDFVLQNLRERTSRFHFREVCFPVKNGPEKFARRGVREKLLTGFFRPKNDDVRGHCNENFEHEKTDFRN